MNKIVKHYKINDEELIYKIHKGNKIAEDILINKYKKFIIIKSKEYFIIGGDKDDLIQEGMIGLYKAIKDFNINKHVKFYTFANLCISRQIFTAIKSFNGKKHLPLNSSVSYNNSMIKEDLNNIKYLKYEWEKNPEYILLKKECTSNIKEIISNYLSKFEKEVMKLYIKGNTYSEISKIVNKNEKAIDNAIQRSRKKFSKLSIAKI